MTRPKLIGLTGFAGSGKSTAACYLTELGYKRYRFAGALKHMLFAMGLNWDEVDGGLKDQPCALLGGKTPRHAMITLGTEWGRNLIDENLWVRVLMSKLDYDDRVEESAVVIDDVRFPSEVVAIRERGGVIWRIKRGGLNSSHVSETGQSEIVPDVIINNTGSLPYLYNSLLLQLGGNHG